MKKLIALVFTGLLIGFNAAAQKPEIVSMNKTNAPTGSIVTINGNDLGNDPSKVKVFFGGALAEIKSLSNQLVEVYTPAGTTFDNVSITNTTSHLTTYSPQRFFMNFSGAHGLTADNFSTQTDFTAESGLYDLCSCDFNNDGKVDIASVGEKANTISFFLNGSIVGTITLNRATPVLINAGTLHVTCGDLNGDGNAEIVASENNGDRIFILKNNGNSTFSTTTPIKLTGNKVKRVAISDLDLNGKPELIITDQLKKIVTILDNQSTSSAFSFGNPLKITLPAVLNSSDGLDVHDLNGDGLPEIVTSHILSSADNKIFILINKSSPGNFNFDDKKVISENNAIVNIRIGDLDGDQMPDLVVTRILNSDVNVYRNTTTGDNITFADPMPVLTSTRPWGLDFGDLDGDGKLDIAVASIENSSLTVLNNTSTPGTISFAPKLTIPTNFINKHIRIGDIDGDGKPDLTFTSIDNGTGTVASKISVIRNKSCMVPMLSPEGPLEICEGLEIELSATQSGGTSYQWKNAASNIGAAGPESTLAVTDPGTYSVTATSVDGCEKTSGTVTINVSLPGAGLSATPPDARNDGPVCSDNSLKLEVSDVGATKYRWTGPENFTVTTTSLSTTLQNFQIANAGLYVVEMFSGDCVSKIDSTIVEGVNVPDFVIEHSGSEDICQGESKTLFASPVATSGFTYQWLEETTGVISAATSSSLAVSATGNYSLQITPSIAGCAPVVTDKVKIVVVTPPQAAFTVQPTICLGSETKITNQSVVDAQAQPVYAWTMGSDDTQTGVNPTHSFTDTGDKTIILALSYDGVNGCTSTTSQTLKVVAAVKADIAATLSALCPSDSSVLSLEGTYKSVVWNNNEETNTITIKEPGDYSVQTVDNNNCVSSDAITIDSKAGPVITATAPKDVITFGESIELTASITPQPLNVGAVYAWSPKETLDDSTKMKPTAKPAVTTLYTVKGTTTEGCSAEASVTIQVATEGLGIKAAPLFSPNNDGTNDDWVIQGVLNYPDCSLNIFDSKGRRVYEKKGYQNDWKADVNGNQLPEGVYYFVFGCPDEKPVTGTVTVVR
jgi:gliding motility-associated-like protein